MHSDSLARLRVTDFRILGLSLNGHSEICRRFFLNRKGRKEHEDILLYFWGEFTFPDFTGTPTIEVFFVGREQLDDERV